MNNEMEKRLQDLKELLNKAVPYFVDFAAGIGVGLLVCLIFGIPFAFIRDINMDLVRFFPGVVGMCVTLYRRAFKRGYHANSRTYHFSLEKAVKNVAISFAGQALLVIIIGAHAVYVTGPTYWITETLFPAALRSDMGSHFLHEGYDWLLMFLADILLYGPTMIYGEYVGSKERKKDYHLETQE